MDSTSLEPADEGTDSVQARGPGDQRGGPAGPARAGRHAGVAGRLDVTGEVPSLEPRRRKIPRPSGGGAGRAQDASGALATGNGPRSGWPEHSRHPIGKHALRSNGGGSGQRSAVIGSPSSATSTPKRRYKRDDDGSGRPGPERGSAPLGRVLVTGSVAPVGAARPAHGRARQLARQEKANAKDAARAARAEKRQAVKDERARRAAEAAAARAQARQEKANARAAAAEAKAAEARARAQQKQARAEAAKQARDAARAARAEKRQAVKDERARRAAEAREQAKLKKGERERARRLAKDLRLQKKRDAAEMRQARKLQRAAEAEDRRNKRDDAKRLKQENRQALAADRQRALLMKRAQRLGISGTAQEPSATVAQAPGYNWAVEAGLLVDDSDDDDRSEVDPLTYDIPENIPGRAELAARRFRA